ncbi:MAG: kynureninase [Pyrinomonadaceae bacterium]|nr:kynureninase [Pyrinomonadaceae bacterium]
MNFENNEEFARKMDELDLLKNFRDKFYIPMQESGEEVLYFTGNSLGLQPKTTRNYIEQELKDWEMLGVEGHFAAKNPWMPYHETVTTQLANIVGARKSEVVAMNSLTANLHFLMVSFYRPTAERYKIVIEGDAFPSDKYAVKSQIEFHKRSEPFAVANGLTPANEQSEPSAVADGLSSAPINSSKSNKDNLQPPATAGGSDVLDNSVPSAVADGLSSDPINSWKSKNDDRQPPATAGGSDWLIELKPRENETCLRTEDILKTIEENGDSIALILLGGVNYYTGQKFDFEKITEAGHEIGAIVGFDLAHAAGNVELKLHDWNVDFAAWCSYKYLNSGPGGIAGIFVHERHHENPNLPRFAGWWGHDKETRFLMEDEFIPIKSAEGWQLSNPPIFQLAALKASLDIFEEAGMHNLIGKSRQLTKYLEFLLNEIETDRIEIITPSNENDRGCQLSIRVKNSDKTLFNEITKRGVIADWREPDVIRVAPVPLYNSFLDCWEFAEILKNCLTEN